jgi:hypothetical protein
MKAKSMNKKFAYTGWTASHSHLQFFYNFLVLSYYGNKQDHSKSYYTDIMDIICCKLASFYLNDLAYYHI